MYVEILFPGGLINNLPPVMHRDQPTKLEQQNFIQHLQFLPVICISQWTDCGRYVGCAVWAETRIWDQETDSSRK